MRNMYNVLYTRYIDQIKLQEIQNYNQKHRNYLVRSGKQTNNPQKFQTLKQNPKNQNNQPRANKPQKKENEQTFQNPIKENNPRKRQFPVNKQTTNFNPTSNQDRPIKSGNNKFHFTEYPEQQTLKNRQINSRPINHTRTQNQYENLRASSVKQLQERAIKPSNQVQESNQQMTQFAQEQENIVLQECPEGCGRKFKPETLQKHIRICQKVFQAKRKPFKVDVVDEEAKKIALKNEKIESKNQKPKQQKVPKWKKESEMLRKGLKAHEAAGSSQSIPVQEEDDRIQCGGCGRKFNSNAAERHIEKCMSRNKQKR